MYCDTPGSSKRQAKNPKDVIFGREISKINDTHYGQWQQQKGIYYQLYSE
jgi:hypothetical protein